MPESGGPYFLLSLSLIVKAQNFLAIRPSMLHAYDESGKVLSVSHPHKFSVPVWVGPEQRQEFVLRLAALYHTMNGSLNDLSKAIGRSEGYLHMSLKGSGINAETCIKLEELLGRDNFPREFFRPDIFIAE